MKDLSWQEDALCAELTNKDAVIAELFFSEDSADTNAAKKICGDCPVRRQCLSYALETEERFGVWGGADENTIRRALSIDQYGHPTVRLRAMKCPYCQSKNIRTLTTRPVKSHVRCEDCKLMWWTRKKTEIISVIMENDDDNVE